MLSLAAPLFLLLLPAPLLARRLRPRRETGGAALKVPEGVAKRLGAIPAGRGDRLRRRHAPLLIWALLVVALAGPQLLVVDRALPVSGRDMVLALDLSGSMVREDFSLDGRPMQRLAAVKKVASAFVERRAGDRVALVIFASQAFFATPQTYDVQAVSRAINEATIGVAGRATGISEGLGLALKRLAESEAAGKVVILLSDGVNNSGPVRPRDAARLAKSLGVRVHTIALGPLARGEEGAGRDAVDAATLEAIAALSGGEAFRVRDMEDLVAVAAAIDRLETNDAAGPAALVHRALWAWPAALAVLLAGGLALWEARR